MRLNSRSFVLMALAAAAMLPPSAGAMVPKDYGPGPVSAHTASAHLRGVVCGKDYSKNSVSGDYCAPRAHSTTTVRSATSSPPAQVVVKNDGFSWANAAAGAGMALAIGLVAAGAAVAIRRRRPAAPTDTRRSPATG
jgi:MYXO-CTERM domain-containing protein